MKKNHKPSDHIERFNRFAALSVNYNVRYDGQYDSEGGRFLKALLVYATTPRKRKRKTGPAKAPQ